MRGDYAIEQHCQCVPTETLRHQNVRETSVSEPRGERDSPRKLRNLVIQKFSCAPTFEISQSQQLRGRINFG